MKKKYYLLLIFIIIAIFSCSEETDPVFEEDNFTAIFDNNQFSSSYYPIDLKQTADGGYLILAETKIPDSNFRGIYLLKIDKTGDFVRELSAPVEYVNPVGDFMEQQGKYYFFCMDASTQGYVASVDDALSTIDFAPVGITYPAAASKDGSNFVLLSYDNENKLSVVSRHNLSGASVGEPASFSIGAGDDVEEPIINHFIHTGRRFPFQVGKVGNLYFYNGFENYTFSLVFTDLTPDSDPIGIVQGQQDDGGFSAIHPLSGNKFAAARFNFGDNYFLPNVTLQTNNLYVADDLGGNTLPELTSNAPVKIINAMVNTKNVLIYASDTRSKQIGLFFYDEASGEFISSRYLGFSNPFEIAGMIQTEDEGLAVCGTTYLAGRFPRICLFKISKEELNKQID